MHLTVDYFAYKLYLFIFDKIVNVKHPQFPPPPPHSLIFKQHTFLSIWFGLYIVADKFPNQIKIVHLFFLYFFGTPHFSFKSRLCYQKTFNIEVLPLKVKFLVFQTSMQLFIVFTICVRIFLYKFKCINQGRIQGGRIIFF